MGSEMCIRDRFSTEPPLGRKRRLLRVVEVVEDDSSQETPPATSRVHPVAVLSIDENPDLSRALLVAEVGGYGLEGME